MQKSQASVPGFFLPVELNHEGSAARGLLKICNCCSPEPCIFCSDYSLLSRLRFTGLGFFSYALSFLFDIFCVFARLRDLGGCVQLPIGSGHNKNL